jgi:hypothetical protein
MRFIDEIEVRQNVHIIARERGKKVAERHGHNIFLNLGREWLAELISLTSLNPDVTARDDRIKYIGLGIGGTRQLALSYANSSPYGGAGGAYEGTNAQTDINAAVTILERPVRLSGGEDPYPGDPGDIWIGAVQAPPEHGLATETTFRRLFGPTDISYGSFASVPLSEVGLMTSTAVSNFHQNQLVAYDTFDTISKTGAVELEIIWTLKF